jgi:integrase
MDVQQARTALAKGSLKLTDKGVRELPPPPTGSVIYTDGSRAEVRVTAAGARAWVFRYRSNGRSVTYTIGDTQNWKATAAQKEAQHLTRLVDQGRDPHGEKKAAREAPTMKELCDRYLEEHAAKKRSEAEDRRMIDTIIRPALGARKVAEIEFEHVDQLHRRITTKGTRTGHGRGAPYTANRVVSLLSKMFALSRQWKMRSDNPARGVARNYEEPLERYLKADELDRLLDVLARWPDPQIVDIVYLLMEMGCRPSELFGATWAQFDAEPGRWVKRSSHTKQEKTHRVPLSGSAQLRLNRMRESSKSEFLFPGKGVEHVTTIKKSWASICKAAKIEGRFRLYDLRHSAASFLADDGRDLLTIGAMLGHAQQATTKRYVHLFDDKLRAAAEGMGARLERKPKAEVQSLRHRR